MPISLSLLKALDNAVRSDLISQRDWYAWCIFWSTLAVVIGCAMEVPEVVHELWSDLFAERFVRGIKIIASIGLGLVVLGVAGELTFEHWRSEYEGLLEEYENIVLVDAERQIALAEIQAGSAADSAERSLKSEDALEKKAKLLRNNLDITASKLRSAEKDISKLERRTAWRTLTKEQKGLLKTDLAKLPKVHLQINVLDDPEAEAFAAELYAFLQSKEIGWTVNGPQPIHQVPEPRGLIFIASSGGPFPANSPGLSIVKLHDDLGLFKLSPSGLLDKSLGKTEFILWVGSKVQTAP